VPKELPDYNEPLSKMVPPLVIKIPNDEVSKIEGKGNMVTVKSCGIKSMLNGWLQII